MAPRCTPFGPRAYYNYWRYPEAWQRSYNESAPHARFCGHVALNQLELERDYLVEQPWPSMLFDEPPMAYRDATSALRACSRASVHG